MNEMFRPPRPTSLTLNLAPMVDVMMCLIVFFLLGSSLVLQEARPVDLPWAASAATVEMGELGNRIVVNVRRGAGEDEAELLIAGWDGERVTETRYQPEQLRVYLTTIAGATRARKEEVRCVVRADRDVAYRHVEGVLKACGAAKIARVVFSVNPGVEP